ncbi:hypothetical protein [Actinomyces oris]|uniref:hypothetical protein n=1 Tax=Actinomyces oris TaxID=544580 RepID=UPI000A8CA58C|nr:hypothetical protein [Actinomyces oris]
MSDSSNVCTVNDSIIDVTIPGSVNSVRSAASWLHRLRDDFYDAEIDMRNNGLFAGNWLDGELSDALVLYSGDLERGCDDAYQRAKKAVDIIRTFADELSSRKEDMSGHLETARNDGLAVEGNIIHYPAAVSAPGKYPKGGTSDEKSAWNSADDKYNDYLQKVRDFEKVRGRVEYTFKQLSDWIANNLAPTKTDVVKDTVTAMFRSLLVKEVGVGYEYTISNVYKSRIDALNNAAKELASTRAQIKSENPRVAAGGEPSDEAVARNKARSGTAKELEDAASSAGKSAKKLIFRGNAILTLGSAAYELSQGADPGNLLVTTATGLAIDAGVAALVAAGVITAPGWGTAVLVGAATVAVSTGVGYVYDHALSKRTRETINRKLDNAGTALMETGEDIANTAQDLWEDASSTVSHGWKWMTS